jgi:hypothetical protein
MITFHASGTYVLEATSKAIKLFPRVVFIITLKKLEEF